MRFKFSTIGSNESGSRIFCKLSCENHNVLRGFYDFNLEKFIIIKYMYNNFPQVGDFISSSEPSKLKKLFSYLNQEVSKRKAYFNMPHIPSYGGEEGREGGA